jgi:N-acylneuraminate cytidylyltransferase
MKIYAFIFARGGSKGIPDKNIRLLAGKPLLAGAIEIARDIPEINRVFVSTDDANIAEIARVYGAEVIDRPPELAQDDTPEWFAWQHAVKWLEARSDSFDVFLSLPATSPLRSKSDVLNCLKKLDDVTDMVVTYTEASRSPWFNMVQIENDERLRLLMEGNYTRRQDVPEGYDMTTVAYVTRPSFILNHEKIWDGFVRGVLIPPERAIDIDTMFDFEMVKLILNKDNQC